MRCLTLADALRERGADTRFICRPHPGHLIDVLERRGMTVSVLPAAWKPRARSVPEDYTSWLGATQDEDGRHTIEALRDERPDWLIVDHYGLDAIWEQRLRPHTARLMVIDDLANRRHDCDLLLDQNYSSSGALRYRGLLTDGCALALGPRYALLRPEYLRYRGVLRTRDGRVRRVLIAFGGSDADNVTGMALEAISRPGLDHLEVDVVIGPNNRHRPALDEAIGARPLVRAHGPRSHLADLMAEADLAVGAGGATTWERLCLGLPSLVVSIAENQEPACEALSEGLLVRYLGRHGEVGPAVIAAALRECIASPEAMAALSLRGQLTVDGLGTMRLAEHLDPTPAKLLHLRPASRDDELLYFDWVNDPDVRRQAIRTEQVTLNEHRAWFASRLTSTQTRLFVMCAGKLPVGQIRFDREGAQERIGYSIDPLFRGRGWGKRLVSLGVQQMQGSVPIVFRAEVKEANLSSRAVFARLGFDESAPRSDGLRTYLLDTAVRKLPGAP